MLMSSELHDRVKAEANMVVAEMLAVDYVARYLGIKAKIAALEAEAKEAREAVATLLQGEPGKEWAFAGIGTVAVVKGRVSEKLDRAALAAGGVAKALLDAATVRTEGEPSLRISAEKPKAEA